MKQALKAALEVLSMQAKLFHEITEHGVKEARQMVFLVEEGHDAIHFKSYGTVRHALTQNLEKEAVKKRTKVRLDRATN